MWRRSVLIGAAIAALACGVAQADELDSMLAPGDKFRTRLVAGEGKTVGVGALAGSKMTVTVKRAKHSTVQPRLEVSDPDGVQPDLGKRLKASKSKALAKGVVIDRTGVWRVGFFSLEGGGDVDVIIAAKPPKKLKWKDSLDEETPVLERTFAALPGSQLKVSAKSSGKVKWTPIVEILDPNGDVLVQPIAAKDAGLPVFADVLGDYTVRVSGGTGAFVVGVAVKAPRVKGRLLEYKAIEALPRIDSFTPATPQNDDTTRITLTGVGFSGLQSVTISTPERGYASAKVKGATAGGVYADLDLTGVPPGEYRLGISTSAGNVSYADAAIRVTNRAPGVILYSAPEFPAYPAVDLRVTGRGFDADCVVGLTRTSDGRSAPAYVVAQESHTILDLVVTPPRYQTGAYDVTIWDPTGEYRTFPEALEIVGVTREPSDINSRFASYATEDLYAWDTAFDADSNRVLVSIGNGSDAKFVLIDARNQNVIQTFTMGTAGARYGSLRVSWSPVDDTFAMAYTRKGPTDYGVVRICSASDLEDELSSTIVATNSAISQVDVAANRDDGGFVAVWEEYNPTIGSQIRAQRFASDGTPDEDSHLAFENEAGLAWSPTIVYRGDDSFVVGHVGATKLELDYALRRIVLRSDGSLKQGSLQVASSVLWYNLYQPEVAVNPNNGDVLLGFTYQLYDRYRPGFVMLDGAGASPGEIQSHDGEGLLAYGILDSVVWNPQRDEFVVSLSVGGGVVAIRRVESDSRLRPAYVFEAYEGVWARLWSGPEAGELGLVWTYDGDEDGYHSSSSEEAHIRAAPLY